MPNFCIRDLDSEGPSPYDVPWAQLPLPDRLAYIQREREATHKLFEGQTNALIEDQDLERKKARGILNGAVDGYEFGYDPGLQFPSKSLKETRERAISDAQIQDARLLTTQTRLLALQASAQNQTLLHLNARSAQTLKEIQDNELYLRTNLPGTPAEFEEQMKLEPDHAIAVAKFLLEGNLITKKAMMAYARQTGKVWSEENIKALQKAMTNIPQFNDRLTEVVKASLSKTSSSH